MSHYSARAQWNTANARLANKPFDDLFAPKAAPEIQDPTLEQVACAYDELEARFPVSMEIANLQARGFAIEEALRDEFIRPEVANVLLDELLSIDRRLEELGI